MKKGPEIRGLLFDIAEAAEARNYCGVVGFGAAGLGADGTGVVPAPAAGVVGAGTPDFTL